MLNLFQPDWLKDPAYRALLSEIYKFTKENGTPPSVNVLDSIFQAEDPAIYEATYKAAIERVRAADLDLSEQIHILNLAKDVAICRSLDAMTKDMDFQSQLVNWEGARVLKSIHRWLKTFETGGEEESSDLMAAWEQLIKDQTSLTRQIQAPTGFPIIDDWTYGGLSSKQLGIIMGSTGGGKSVMLLNFAFKMAIQDELSDLRRPATAYPASASGG
jgi:hypothetical protein